jgi:hypothetical protein
MRSVNVNKTKDFLERVLWTAIQAGAATAIVALSSDSVDWEHAAKTTAIAAAIAALKVLAFQNIGDTDLGAFPEPLDDDPADAGR